MKHRKLLRLQGYDYSSLGYYFVTILIKDRATILSEIVNEKVVLSAYGKIVEKEWLNTPSIRPNITLHEYVIMPNHIHGIIELTHVEMGADCVVRAYDEVDVRTNDEGNVVDMGDVRADDVGDVVDMGDVRADCNPPLRDPSKSTHLGSVIRGFKIAVIKQLKDNFPNDSWLLERDYKIWHRSYHDRIIRNEQEFYAISNYILSNPERWR